MRIAPHYWNNTSYHLLECQVLFTCYLRQSANHLIKYYHSYSLDKGFSNLVTGLGSQARLWPFWSLDSDVPNRRVCASLISIPQQFSPLSACHSHLGSFSKYRCMGHISTDPKPAGMRGHPNIFVFKKEFRFF